MSIERYTHSMTVDASGDLVFTTPTGAGWFVGCAYVDDDFSANWDIDITGTTSGIVFLVDTTVAAANAAYWPIRFGSVPASGADHTNVGTRLPIVGETLTVTVANAGNATSGTLHLYIDGDWQV